MTQGRKIAPTAFTFVRHDQFVSNANGFRDKTSLLVPILERVPMQPAYPAMHPAMEELKKDPTRRGRDFLDNMLQTDAAFQRWAAEHAIARNTEDREFARWLVARLENEKHALKWVFEEDKRRLTFFQKASWLRAINVSRAASSRVADVEKTLRAEYEAALRRDVVNTHNEQVVRKMGDRLQELSAHFSWSDVDLEKTLTDLAVIRQMQVQMSTEKSAVVMRYQSHVALAQTIYGTQSPTPEAADLQRPLSASTAKLLAKRKAG